MNLPPLFDSVGNPLLVVLVLILLLLQWRFPLRRQHFNLLRRLIRNYVVSIPGFVIVRFAMLPIPLAIAVWAQARHFGLFNWLGLAGWLGAIGGFLLMDYAYWWWHRVNHMVPLFWRFHNVHHTDLDMDVTTAAFHFGEMFFYRLSLSRPASPHRSLTFAFLYRLRSFDPIIQTGGCRLSSSGF
jgi:sterol desaturase/sphingolipid hydroxylase (fatty acid hydroxylase superfamily)